MPTPTTTDLVHKLDKCKSLMKQTSLHIRRFLWLSNISLYPLSETSMGWPAACDLLGEKCGPECMNIPGGPMCIE